MKKKHRSFPDLATQQGAAVLLAATVAFLQRNNISKRLILDSVRLQSNRRSSYGGGHQYNKLVRAYEDMGMIMSTWFSRPKFLDRESHPQPLSTGRGKLSIQNLVRSSRVKIPAKFAMELMRRSPSVRVDTRGRFVAVKRVFVLPNFEIPRAALVIDRYLDTLRRNSSAHKNGTTLLLERNCRVPEVELKRITPILRDIKERGTAFVDSVDGDIESHRIRRSRRSGLGELGVLVFAWTRPQNARNPSSVARSQSRT
jgi:Family of unknown function (DUF6502)